MKLGTNIEGPSEWERSEYFIDCMKSARTFGTPATNQQQDANGNVVPVARDAYGNPLADFATYLFADNIVRPGTYKLSFDGTATIAVQFGATIQNETVIAGQHTTADLVVPAGVTMVWLSFTNTAGKVKNVRCIRPGYTAADADRQIFTNEFIAAVKPFGTVRTMDFTRTNGNQQVNWTDRATPAKAEFTDAVGAPWEYCVALANATGATLQVNVPWHASADYQAQLAKLLAACKAPPIVELSNEVWNDGFEQGRDALKLAAADPDCQPTPDNDYSRGTGPYPARGRYYAKRASAMAAVMKAANPNLQFVLCWQPDPWNLGVVLDYLHRHGGTANFAAVGCAPFWDKTGAQSLDWIKATLTGYKQMAAADSLALWCYEGGPNNWPAGGDDVTTFLNAVAAGGADSLCYYLLADTDNNNEYWQLTADIRALAAAPKYVAAVKFIGAPVPATPPAPVPTPSPAPVQVATPTPTPTAAPVPIPGGPSDRPVTRAEFDAFVNWLKAGPPAQ